MSLVKVSSFGLSIDGFGAGPNQSLDDPLGVGGRALMEWAFGTRSFQQMHGGNAGSTGVDDDFAARLRERRRVNPRAQHVRPGARALAGR